MLFAAPRLDSQTLEVIERIDQLRATLGWATVHQARRWGGLLRRNAFAKVIQGSNSIEGYIANDDDAVAVVERDDPMNADDETRHALVGYRDAMTYVVQLADDPHFSYSVGLLRSLHFMMTQYDLGKNPGRWRPGYIAVRNSESGKVVYEAPDADLVPGLVDELVARLQAEEETRTLPALVRGALSHLNLVMIHPFSDGNGRMARCLQSLVLAREQILSPAFCSIEEELSRSTLAYYDTLGQVGAGKWSPQRDTTPWVRFVLQAHWTQAKRLESRARRISQLWDEIERIAVAEGLPDRVVPILADAALGYMVRNSRYRLAAGVPQNLASRDLKAMADRGLLIATGEKRGRRYAGAPRLRAIWNSLKESRPPEDPFQTTKVSVQGTLFTTPAPAAPRVADGED